MKQHFLIKYLLSGITQLWLLLSFLNCLLLAFFLITGKDAYLIKNKNFSFGRPNIYQNGYPIPATLSVAMPADTIVKWKHGNANGNIGLHRDAGWRYEKADSIMADTAIQKQYYFSKWLIEPGFSEWGKHEVSYGAADEFALFDTIVKQKSRAFEVNVERNYTSAALIKLKSSSGFRNFALVLYSVVSAIAMLLVSFNVFRLFQYIGRGNHFLQPLYKIVFNIGLILILTEIIKIILSLLYARWYGAVTLEKVSSIANIGGTEFSVQFNPSSDFNGMLFLFGLALIVLASLFKHGNKLEKENALTI